MPDNFTWPVTYFLQEGRDNLRECLKTVFAAAKEHGIGKIVIFTARGDGVRLAIEDYLSKDDYRGIKLVAVTFPQGKRFTGTDSQPIEVEISPENVELLNSRGVPIIRAHLPFDPILPVFKERGNLSQDLALVGSALNMFGGSMSLCVQATVIACDSGTVKNGEHVISMTSDTAILVQAVPTRLMLSELAIREILCKPAIYSIGRNEQSDRFLKKNETKKSLVPGENKALPE
jgi:hypothetical protein